MKTAKTPRTATTIADWAEATTFVPTRLSAEHDEQDKGDKEVVPAVARVLADEQRGRVAAEGDGDHRGHDHDRGDVPEPRRDPDQASHSESLDEVGDQSAR